MVRVGASGRHDDQALEGEEEVQAVDADEGDTG